MIKLIFGIVIVLAILFIIYQVRKENDKLKIIKDETEELNEVADRLVAMDIKEEVIDKKTELQKRQNKLSKKEDKLNP